MLDPQTTSYTDARLTLKGSEFNLTYWDGAFFSKHPDNSGPMAFDDAVFSYDPRRFCRWRHYDLTGPLNRYTDTRVAIRLKARSAALYAAHNHLKGRYTTSGPGTLYADRPAHHH